jgi:hypothetical protein
MERSEKDKINVNDTHHPTPVPTGDFCARLTQTTAVYQIQFYTNVLPGGYSY